METRPQNPELTRESSIEVQSLGALIPPDATPGKGRILTKEEWSHLNALLNILRMEEESVCRCLIVDLLDLQSKGGPLPDARRIAFELCASLDQVTFNEAQFEVNGLLYGPGGLDVLSGCESHFMLAPSSKPFAWESGWGNFCQYSAVPGLMSGEEIARAG